MSPTLDCIIEDSIANLKIAHNSFQYLWEEYFSQAEKPKDWEMDYGEISVHMTAYKILMDRIINDLLATYGMAGTYHVEELKLLFQASRGLDVDEVASA